MSFQNISVYQSERQVNRGRLPLGDEAVSIGVSIHKSRSPEITLSMGKNIRRPLDIELSDYLEVQIDKIHRKIYLRHGKKGQPGCYAIHRSGKTSPTARLRFNLPDMLNIPSEKRKSEIVEHTINLEDGSLVLDVSEFFPVM